MLLYILICICLYLFCILTFLLYLCTLATSVLEDLSKFFLRLHECVRAKSLQLCPTLCNPMDCSPPGSSVHGILQARTLEWVAMPSYRGSSQPESLTSPALAGSSLPLVPPGKPYDHIVFHVGWIKVDLISHLLLLQDPFRKGIWTLGSHRNEMNCHMSHLRLFSGWLWTPVWECGCQASVQVCSLAGV